MTINEIEKYLNSTEYRTIDQKIFESIGSLKLKAIEECNEEEANYLWCIEQVAKAKKEYFNAINYARNNEQLKAWVSFDRCEIEASFVKRHMNFDNNKYQIEFILEQVIKFQKLFPYKVFMSRESIESNFSCSICGKKIELRSDCGHIVGDLYNGEMCFRLVGNIEFLAIAMVSNPVDKYTVPQIQGHQYDYSLINFIVERLSTPYQKWDYNIELKTWTKNTEKSYKNLGRNDTCACGSGKKYKKCCFFKEGTEYEHYNFTLYSD